jgi:hypothetical protein
MSLKINFEIVPFLNMNHIFKEREKKEIFRIVNKETNFLIFFVQVSMAFENLAKNAGLQSYSTNDYISSVRKLILLSLF